MAYIQFITAISELAKHLLERHGFQYFLTGKLTSDSLEGRFGWYRHQRWSPRGRPWPRGHILKSLALALASKVKSLALASRPQVLENWPVLGSRTARFFGMLKFCGALEKFFGKRFFLKNFCEDLFFFFFWRALALCVLGPWPWPRAFLSLASRVSVLGKAVLGLGLGFFLCPWPRPWPRALCPRLHL